VELINALVLAGPLGYLVRDRRRSLGLWLAVWVVVLPIQTVVVARSSDDASDPLYVVFNAGFLALGIGLNLLGARVRTRRDARAARAVEATS
jgi:peptidoglycan/LPS O-acetylase OafA/YrhL